MQIKQIPEDFLVDELYDLKTLEVDKEKEDSGSFYYFILKKTNYAQLRAMGIVANIFNTSQKLVHFAGTKDKNAITTQIISVNGIKQANFEKNLNFFNERIKDLELEFIGKFKTRLNLGDNLGNKFKITIRDLEKEEIELAKKNLETLKKGFKNSFDSQRFGYANNSHIIGKYMLKGDLRAVIKEILSSKPKQCTENLGNFADFIQNNWEYLEKSEKIDEAIKLAPKFMRGEVTILKHLKNAPGDFHGAFRTIHKKLRTLYLNAYQSYVFNTILDDLKEIDLDLDIPLISLESNLESEMGKKILKILKEDDLTIENFKLESMPELLAPAVTRKAFIKSNNLEILEVSDDDLNEGKQKLIVEFNLGSGSYATTLIKDLFKQ